MYLLSLLVPLVVYNLTLKIFRVFSQPEITGVSQALGLVRSDLLFNLGYAVGWIWLFAVAKGGTPRRVVTVLFHAVTALVALTTTSAHQYFEETGSTLEFGVIWYSLTTLGEIRDVIISVASPIVWGSALLVVLYAVFGPRLVAWIACRSRGRSTPAGSARVPGRVSLGVCLLVFVLFSLSLPTGEEGPGRSFSRDAVVNLFASKVRYETLQESTVGVAANAVPRDPPTSTVLERTPRTEKRNVVFIHLESTRAQSVTPYNEYLYTTPFLDGLAENSLLAEQAYTVVPHTSKAITAVNCGIEPHLVRGITEAEPNGVPARCLPGLLEEQGYDTALFQSATEEFEDRPQLVRNFGYEDFYPLEKMDTEGFQRSTYFGYEDNIMLEPSREWLEEHGDEPFMATYLGVTGHHDYRPVDRYGFEYFAEDEQLNDYQNSVRYLDFFVRNVIEQYKEMGLYEETVFVIYGDHGEGFGEHGLYQHDDTIYEEGVRIPLIIHDPRRFKGGRRVNVPTNQMDILPTVTDLLGYRVTGGEYPGRSLLAPPPDKNRTLFLSCFDQYRCLAKVKGDKKYVYFFDNQPDELYDLSEDPLELNNIVDELSRKERKERRSRLLTWYSTINNMYEEHTPPSR